MTQKSILKRVLILITAYLPQVGGSELAIKNITDRLPGISFDLITSRPSKKLPEYERMGSVNVYRVGGSLGLSSFLLPKNFFPIAVFFKACQLMHKYGSYDVIHAYQTSQAAGGGWLLKWRYPHTPFMVTVQEGKVLNKQPLLMRFFRYLIFRKADAVTVISNYLAQYVRTQNPKVPINIIPNGVDLKKFTSYHLPISSEDKKEQVIITASRLVPKNGIGDLIDAMAILINGKSMENGKWKTTEQSRAVAFMAMGNVKLLIVGDGPLRENLKFKIKNLKLENKIELLGEVSPDKVPQYLAEADIFVRPSLSEGLGTAFLEAMAVGLPIIGTPVGGIPDFLKDDETGLFCKVGNPNDIAEKIIKLLENGELRNKLAENGRRLVEEKYDWDIIVGEFREIYGKL